MQHAAETLQKQVLEQDKTIVQSYNNIKIMPGCGI